MHQRRCSASADRISSRAIEIAIGFAAYPNLGFRSRCVEAGSHAFTRCPAESREGVGDAEDAVFDLGDGLDAARLRDGHFHLGMGIRSALTLNAATKKVVTLMRSAFRPTSRPGRIAAEAGPRVRRSSRAIARGFEPRPRLS